MSTISNAAETMLGLKEQLATIMTVIPSGSNVALLDGPVHRNIGDHIIHLGTERLFQDHGVNLVARAHIHNYNRRWLRRRIDENTIIVCSGGGHLGDLYPHHQRLREQAVADFSGHRIVVLPQSVYFRDAACMKSAADIFRRHGNVHLFLRDRDSLRKAETMGLDNLHLAPDMAHALYPVVSPFELEMAHGDTLSLLRRDMEGAASARMPEDVGAVHDWPDLIRPVDTFILAAIAVASRLCSVGGPPKSLDDLLDRCRANFVARGIRLIASYDVINSSRLHGALLGLLLGKKVRFLENLTSKSKFYYDTWLADCSDCAYGSEEF